MSKRILFVNHPQTQCGVHQYGHTFYEFLKEDPNIDMDLIHVVHLAPILDKMKEVKYDMVIFNYYPDTLPFVTTEIKTSNIKYFDCPSVCLLHAPFEGFGDLLGEDKFFQMALFGDQGASTCGMGPLVKHFGRILPPYNRPRPVNPIPIVGSYGFSNDEKGYDRVVELTQESFDEAIIRINISMNTFCPDTLPHVSRNDARYLSLVKKPGIKLEITHDFYDTEAMLDFLAANDINVFPYRINENPCIGISSSPDYAIAAGTPVAVVKSTIFRHINSFNLPICVEDHSLKEILENGPEMIKPIRDEWSPENQRKIIYEALSI